MHITAPTEARKMRRQIIQRVQRATDMVGVFALASPALNRLVPFDAAGWIATDPATGIPASPTHSPDFNPGREFCVQYWRNEFLHEDDVNLYRHLARAARPAAALRATIGNPSRSRRYRTFLRPSGYSDELRAVLKVDKSTWAIMSLFRKIGSDPFTDDDANHVAGLSAPLGEALRLRVGQIDSSAAGCSNSQPGMLVFDGSGNLVSANDQANVWFSELADEPTEPTELGIDVPWSVVSLVSQILGTDDGDGAARTRIRTKHGGWLVCHGSWLEAANGADRSIAVVIEPAKAADITPIIVQALDLSEREQQVMRLIARGASTSDIASGLYLSAHTVRDYVKAIFQKVGVSSRGELVAKLYTEFYEPIHHLDKVEAGR